MAGTDFKTFDDGYGTTDAGYGVEASAGVDASITRLREEAVAAVDTHRRARILHEIGELEEQVGDLVAASRDNLAAFQAHQGYLEPLEALLRLTERRKTLANVGKLIEALVRAARSPDERARALVLRAANLADHEGDLEGARGALLEATELEAAPGELAIAWLSLEIVAAKLDDTALREQALATRAELTHHLGWRALLLLDVARLAAEAGELERALITCERALEIEGPTRFAAARELERLAKRDLDLLEPAERARRGRLQIAALEAQLEMVEQALGRASDGDARGVPRSLRTHGVQIDLLLQISDTERAIDAVDPQEGAHAGRALAAIDRALALTEALRSNEGGTQDRATEALALALLRSRLRLGDALGDPSGAQLAQRELERGRAGVLTASLGLRVAASAQSAEERDAALAQVRSADPDSVLAEVMQRGGLEHSPELLVDYLDELATRLTHPEAKTRHWLYAAYLAAFRLNDQERAAALLARAPLPPQERAEIARAFLAARGETAALAAPLRSLLELTGENLEAPLRLGMRVELLRQANKQQGDVRAELDALAADEAGAPLARALFALWPSPKDNPDAWSAERKKAQRELAQEGLGTDDDAARSTFAVIGALETWHSGERTEALATVQALATEQPHDVFLAALRAAMTSTTSTPADTATLLREQAREMTDPGVGASFLVEAGLLWWRAGQREAAREAFEEALGSAGDEHESALGPLARWSAPSGERGLPALERFGRDLGFSSGATEIAATLDELAETDDPTLQRAAALARVGTAQSGDEEAVTAALDVLGAAGALARRAAAAERTRRALSSAEADLGLNTTASERHATAAQAAIAWLGEGGGFAAALAWIACANRARRESVGAEDNLSAALEERRAYTAAAAIAPSEALRDRLRREAALVFAPGLEVVRSPLLAPDHKESRLVNLELAPPGCDPLRRVAALSEIGDAVDESTELDACGLAGWSALAAGENELALDLFRYVTQAREDDLAAWEGQRSAASATGEREAWALAGEALGRLVSDADRAAQFLEEAGLAWIACGAGYEERGEAALLASFQRAPARDGAFDALFRRLRDRKDHAQVLDLAAAKLEHLTTSDAEQRTQASRLHWERARALREQGHAELAMRELGVVRELDPSHVGALALAGEVHIREGRFDAAADTLAILAALESAPAKSRATAGVTAVDLYENKLSRFDRALEVLDNLHRAGLSTPPIRERLARTAVRAEAFVKATEILEVLMGEREASEGRADAARVAMRIYRDQLKSPRGAERAVSRLLEEQPNDGEAIDLLLSTEFEPGPRQRLVQASLAALTRELSADTELGATARDNALRISQLAQRSAQPALQQAALGLAAELGEANAKERLAQLAAKKPRAPKLTLPATALARLQVQGSGGPIAELFALLGPTLVEALGPTLSALGVTKKDRVDPRAGLALRSEVIAWAGAFGISELELYVGGRDPNLVQGIGGDKPALVLGSQISSPLSLANRGKIARELWALQSGTTVVWGRDELSVASVVVAACRIAKIPFAAPSYASLAEVERLLSKAIARKTRNQLPPLCEAVAAGNANLLGWVAATRTALAQMSLVASGDLPSVMADLPAELPAPSVLPQLTRFSLSPAYAELRDLLNLEAGS